MEIRLVRPAAEHKEAALDFKKEFLENGERIINGGELLDQMDSYEEWLDSVTANISPETVNPDWVVTDTYFAVDGSGRIVGVIDFRHELKGFLTDFGNTGYSVRPSERRKGYATEMLGMIVDRARETGFLSLQLSVERTNDPSVKTILRNGGVYERSFEYEGEAADVYRIHILD
ncbi:MAG: GNAT family N-acetyltransferase [Eubacterium sp.]|nr:GNAT family N-acetyltransferase [Eubacterium sp.]